MAKYIRAELGQEDARQLSYHPESQIILDINPLEFLWMVDPKFLSKTSNAFFPSSYDKVKDRLEKEQPLDSVWLDVNVRTGEILNHEGRHRCLAAIELDIPTVPAILYLKQGKPLSYVNGAEQYIDTPIIQQLIKELKGSNITYVGQARDTYLDSKTPPDTETLTETIVTEPPELLALIERFHIVQTDWKQVVEAYYALTDERNPLRDALLPSFDHLHTCILETARIDVVIVRKGRDKRPVTNWHKVVEAVLDHYRETVPRLEEFITDAAAQYTRFKPGSAPVLDTREKDTPTTEARIQAQIWVWLKNKVQALIQRYDRSLDKLQRRLRDAGFYIEEEEGFTETLYLPNILHSLCLREGSRLNSTLKQRVLHELETAIRALPVLHAQAEQFIEALTLETEQTILENVVDILDNQGWGITHEGTGIMRIIGSSPKHSWLDDPVIVRTDFWYDRHTRLWVVEDKDAEENTVGDARYYGSKGEAVRDVKRSEAERTSSHGVDTP